MHTGNFAHVGGSTWRAGQEQRVSSWNMLSFLTFHPSAVLIFDSKGLVRFCSNALARLIGATSTDLAGTQVRNFMVGLPLAPETEGYNVAFGTFHAAKRCLQPWTIKTRDGGTIPLDGYFGSLSTDDGYRFCLQLNLRSGDKATSDVSPSDEAANSPAMPGASCIPASQLADGDKVPEQLVRRLTSPGAGTPRWRRHRAATSDDARMDVTSVRTTQVQLLFDREYRISFVSSSIEDLLSHDYEKVVGMHVSDLLPEFPSRVGVIRSISSATAQLRDMGCFRSHALHATGRKVPVLLALREKRFNHLISLTISAADR